MEPLPPLSEYLGRIERWRAELTRRQQAFVRMGNLRLAVAVAAGLMAWAAFVWRAFSGWWLLIPGAVFIALVILHERIVRRQEVARRAIAYYERALGRIDGRWAGTGRLVSNFKT